MHYDLSDLWSMIPFRIIPKERQFWVAVGLFLNASPLVKPLKWLSIFIQIKLFSFGWFLWKILFWSGAKQEVGNCSSLWVKWAFATQMVISHLFVTSLRYNLLAGDTTWFADPEYLALLTFFLAAFFDLVPLVHQRRWDKIVLKLLLFFLFAWSPWVAWNFFLLTIKHVRASARP